MKLSHYTNLSIEPDGSGDIQVHLEVSCDIERSGREGTLEAIRFIRQELLRVEALLQTLER